MNQTTSTTIKLHQSWLDVLENEFEKPYFQSLRFFLAEEKKHKKIFPPGSQMFEAFNRTPFNDIKVVILGQDPYHGLGQAHGLCFSVNKGVPLPPSLKNIFKEIENDLGLSQPAHGDLSEWADQGVFLLNATLSVVEGQPGSHQKQGWETFTDEVIHRISDRKKNVVFLLWGKFAQAKADLIDPNKHFVLKAPHPSPFSVHTGFFGCKHFSACNNYLKKNGLQEINWGRSQ